ncbi:hypothetical protein AAFF_G00284420 [Aldrovandia affinis]|uniref:Uncharacterized protein n=1 Tax=Aldrovandia affinis TaxID=143900 RepID=A0AAD7TA79_9TELE|nr:hypothetical protein AAFF_G00284420 [Aldrovandia affinis]
MSTLSSGVIVGLRARPGEHSTKWPKQTLILQCGDQSAEVLCPQRCRSQNAAEERLADGAVGKGPVGASWGSVHPSYWHAGPGDSGRRLIRWVSGGGWRRRFQPVVL